MTEKKKVCFVIMGYGIKTDFQTGRELNLDKSYKNIIKPAVEAAGLTCIRADDIKHSGVIDVPMYEYLHKADLVIADLSTSNANAIYELGVRHALKPYTTILMAEDKFPIPFDLSHTVIRKYEHLGKDIGYDEALRFQQELKDSIVEIMANPQTDSPVHTYLKSVVESERPESEELPIPDETELETFSKIAEQAQVALDQEQFAIAKSLFELVLKKDENNPYLLQRVVLATYKSKMPNVLDALWEAHKLLVPLDPENSTDPETLGLAGAIHKRLWEQLQERSHLDKSIEYYERGFYMKRDYYNGINLAYLLNVRGSLSSGHDQVADYVLANRTRNQVVSICLEMVASELEDRSDKYWILATLEEAYFGLGMELEYRTYKALAEQAADKGWERQTTEDQIAKLGKLLEASPLC